MSSASLFLRSKQTGTALLLPVVMVLFNGCSGINASKSVSPLDFILPGLLQHEAPAPALPESPAPELAQLFQR